MYRIKNWFQDDIRLGEADVADPGLVDIQCWRVHNLLRQYIPQTDGVKEECANHQGGTGSWNIEFPVVASCCPAGWNDVTVRNVDQLVGDTIHVTLTMSLRC